MVSGLSVFSWFVFLNFSLSMTIEIVSFHASLPQWWNFPKKTGLLQTIVMLSQGSPWRECLQGNGIGEVQSRWFLLQVTNFNFKKGFPSHKG